MLTDNILPKVTHTKFLDVIIDNRLSWDYHIKALTKKLSCCTGRLNKIIESIPENLHKYLYHTLYLKVILPMCYGISVWGGSTKAKLLPLFKAQKKVMRVIFGDRAKYLDKFKTCARVRCTRRSLTKKIYAFSKNIYFFKKHTHFFKKHIYFLKNIHTFSKNIYTFLKTYILFKKTYVFLNVYICGKTYIFS